MESLELLILKSIFNNREYADKVVPFIDPKVFEGYAAKNIANMICKCYQNKNELITLDLVRATIENLYSSHKITDEQESDLLSYYDRLCSPYTEQPINTLLDETQNYFRKRLTYQEMQKMIQSFGDNKLIELSDIRKLEDGVNFTFDTEGYYNYMDEFEHRLESYSETTKKFPFPLRALNDCTNGGMNTKSLTIAMASTGGGKSIFLCNCASHLIQLGYNVLYITCEMSVQEIAKRIDANLLSATQDSIMQQETKPQTLRERMNAINGKENWGKLFIKEYPAGFANAGIIRRDLEEIQRKHEAKVDILVLDYLNLLNTSRYSTKLATTYVLVKAIAEEVRGLGQTFDIPVLSATQSNRSALNKDTKLDAGLEAVSDSYGLPQTCDFMFNIISPDEASWKAGHYRLFKILKNRWGDPNKEFIKVHLDTGMARFSDVEGYETAMEEKPIDLYSNIDDKSQKVLNNINDTKKKRKKEEEANDKEIKYHAEVIKNESIF